MKAGYATPDDFKNSKPTQIHQTLNGYRKKNKLDIAALLIEEVEGWLKKD
jgi:lysyl-tRNA synthetase class 2